MAQQSQSRHRAAMPADPFWALDLLPAQIAVVDPVGRVVATNKSWRETAAEGCLGESHDWNYLDECDAAARRSCREARVVADGLRAVLSGRSNGFVDTYPCAFAGRHHWFQVMISPVGDDAFTGATVTHIDVTALQHDPLTGLANRALFDAQAQHVIALAQAEGREAAIAMVDLDGFKAVNDTHGHAAGDLLLCRIANRIEALLRGTEMVARLGGDEFGIVLEPGADPARARDLRASITATLATAVLDEGVSLHVGASVGVARFPDDGTTVAELVRAADRRMYSAKRSRRSRLRRRGVLEGAGAASPAASP